MGIIKRLLFSNRSLEDNKEKELDNLSRGKLKNEYLITEINSKDEDTRKFLFSLGCYEGETVTLISKLGDTFVIKIKDGRYSIDEQLAKAIKVKSI